MIRKEYLSPCVESISLDPKAILMQSGEGNLGDMGENPIISNAPMYPLEDLYDIL